MNQGDLFGAAHANQDARDRLAKEKRGDAWVKGAKTRREKKTLPHNGTDTSVAAANRAAPNAGAFRRRILGELQVRASYGATCDELEQALSLTHQTASARLRDLALAGRVIDSHERRPTRSGRKAIVWVAAEGWR